VKVKSKVFRNEETSSVSQVQDTVTPFSTSYRNVRDFQFQRKKESLNTWVDRWCLFLPLPFPLDTHSILNSRPAGEGEGAGGAHDRCGAAAGGFLHDVFGRLRAAAVGTVCVHGCRGAAFPRAVTGCEGRTSASLRLAVAPWEPRPRELAGMGSLLSGGAQRQTSLLDGATGMLGSVS
jgi:hypothetical protein